MNILQIKASDPAISTWVSASAGTGKTKILTDRVLRLLLDGVAFNKILCLTFTNAASAEMHERINIKLEIWSKLVKNDLIYELKKLLGRMPDDFEVIKASSLFSYYAKTQDQINIYTIHSFCQQILKKFPLESSISPNFKIIDEIQVYQIIKKIKNKVFTLSNAKPVVRFLAANFHQITIDEIFNEVIQIKTKIFAKKLTDKYIDNNDLFLRSYQLIEELENYQEADYLALLDDGIKGLIAELNDNNISNNIIKSFFLTNNGSKRKKILSQKITHKDSLLYKKLILLQEEVYQLDQKEKTKELSLYSKILTIIAEKIITEFEAYKKNNALLDYDDLIIYTKNLLTDSNAREWVLYKLDGFVDHLMVDEAQDTSKIQWSIIAALIEEFYSGESKSTENRTIFIVGDEKQSIFSFQGADLPSFSYMNNFLQQKLSEAAKSFETINLDISYRSTSEILNLVTDVFKKIKRKKLSDFSPHIQKMIPHRDNHSGFVELWPLCINDGIDNQDIWPIAQKNFDNSKSFLAKKIAKYIKDQINSQRILPSTGSKISAKDFMILVRTRDGFTKELIDALEQEEIDIAGLDRVNLIEDLGVLDLVSIAKFVIDPSDNLNLASLLKSPIFGLSEQELYNLIYNKNIESIWQYLKSQSDNNLYSNITKTLAEYILLYENLSVADFFLYLTDVLDYRTIITQNHDIIDEFLKLSRSYFVEYGYSIQQFVYWFEDNKVSIKRDSTNREKLRIMTTHAAKGLQSPIVILCDTTKTPSITDRFIWHDDEILTSKSSTNIPEFYSELKEKEKQKAYQEYLRLLYVGLTRAEDQLVICGYQGMKQIPENCWYNLIRNSIKDLGRLDQAGNLIYGNLSSAHIYGPQFSELSQDTEINFDKSILFDQEKFFADIINSQKFPENSDYAVRSNNSLEYGIIFHKILEDAISSKVYKNFANIDSHPLITSLSIKLQNRIKKSLQKLKLNQEFNDLISKEAKTEVSFGYMDNDEFKMGRVDLLILDKEQITVIDYKSDKNPATTIEEIPGNYRQQIKFYCRAFAKIYPNKNINGKILWLENGVMQDANFS